MAHEGGIVLSLERLSAVREIDPLDEVAVLEAGVLTADLSAALAPHGCFYAPDPASAAISTLGGNIATDAGGLHCAKYGVTRESVPGLEAVLADGTLLRTGHRSIKGVTGLDLTQLLIGSEGTLADIAAHTGARLAPEGADSGAVLLLELDGYGIEQQSADLAAVLTGAGGSAHVVPDPAEAERLWELRRASRAAGGGRARLGEDVAVPTSRLAVDGSRALPRLPRPPAPPPGGLRPARPAESRQGAVSSAGRRGSPRSRRRERLTVAATTPPERWIA